MLDDPSHDHSEQSAEGSYDRTSDCGGHRDLEHGEPCSGRVRAQAEDEAHKTAEDARRH